MHTPGAKNKKNWEMWDNNNNTDLSYTLRDHFFQDMLNTQKKNVTGLLQLKNLIIDSLHMQWQVVNIVNSYKSHRRVCFF